MKAALLFFMQLLSVALVGAEACLFVLLMWAVALWHVDDVIVLASLSLYVGLVEWLLIVYAIPACKR
jgi:hypothetical protein